MRSPFQVSAASASHGRLRAAGVGSAICAIMVVAGCNGPSSEGGSSSDHGAPIAAAPSAPTPSVALTVTSVELAQTHVLPDGARSWSPPTPATASESLHLVGGRSTLALVRLGATDAQSPQIEGLVHGTSLGMLKLTLPSALPLTEAQGPAYGTDLYSATLPASWLVPGLQLRVLASNYQPSVTHTAVVGANTALTVRVLPLYLFGATDANSGQPLSQTATPPAAAASEMAAKWPIATLSAVNHPAVRLSWPTLVVRPRTDTAGIAQPAYVVSNANQQRDSYGVMSSVLDVLAGMIKANGESTQAVQYYVPLVMLDANGKYYSPGGGLGLQGGDVSTGTPSYSGIYIHEVGHGFGLPHAGEAYDVDQYPYAWGSLNGSSWGYDADHNELLAPFVPTSASSYSHCTTDTFAGHNRILDFKGRCVKQDPMQSGAGDQATGYSFATFSDYNTAVMQRHLEGVTTVASDGTHTYSGGKLTADSSFASGYKRWDSVDAKWVNADTRTVTGGIFGLDQGVPIQKGVPVHAIGVTISNAGTAGATQIYPPVDYVGNLMRTFDPTVAADRTRFTPDTGAYPWYCRNGGCDYTLRVTYVDGTTRSVLLQGGFRPFNQPAGTPSATTQDPLTGQVS